MRREEFGLNDELVWFEESPSEFTPLAKANTWRFAKTINHATKVKVIAKKHVYKKRLNKWTDATKDATGIRLEVLEPAPMSDHEVGDQVTIHSSVALMMPWMAFEEQVSESRLKMLQEQKVKKEITAKNDTLKERASKVGLNIYWGWNGNDSTYFSIEDMSYDEVFSLIKAVESYNA